MRGRCPRVIFPPMAKRKRRQLSLLTTQSPMTTSSKSLTEPAALTNQVPVCKNHRNHLIISLSSSESSDLSRFLRETKRDVESVSWLEKCRKVLCHQLTTKSGPTKTNGDYPN